MGNERIVSTHVVKTAGTSVLAFYRDTFGAENVYSYKHQPDGSAHFICLGDSIKEQHLNTAFAETIKHYLLKTRAGQLIYHLIRNGANNVLPAVLTHDLPPEEFSVIHGHFRADQFDIPDAKHVVVLRRPDRRVFSHFNFYNGLAATGGRLPTDFTPGMSFEEFIQLDAQINLQAQYLGSRPLKDFDHIGITEQLDQFCRYFEPAGKANIPHLNRSVNFAPPEIAGSTWELFRELNELDYRLYSEAYKIVTGNEWKL